MLSSATGTTRWNGKGHPHSQGHGGWYVPLETANRLAATPVTDHRFPLPARPPSAIQDDPLESKLLGLARHAYEPLQLADRILSGGTVSPEELDAVAEKWPWARTVVSGVAIQ